MRPTGNCSPALDERAHGLLGGLALAAPGHGCWPVVDKGSRGSWSVLEEWLIVIAAQICDKKVS